MQIDGSTHVSSRNPGAFCELDCEGCRGMCLALYMMLTREEQDAMRHRYRTSSKSTVH